MTEEAFAYKYGGNHVSEDTQETVPAASAVFEFVWGGEGEYGMHLVQAGAG